MKRVVLILAPFALLAACGPGPQPADLVLLNGRVVTLDEARPEATAVAMLGEWIVAVGADGSMQRYVGPATRVIDVQGRLVVPGFIEGHGHFMGLGESLLGLDLAAAERWEDIVAMVAGAVAEAEDGEWIVGRGWHQEKWRDLPDGAVDGVPTHHTLSAISPRNPVLLTHASGHAAFANALALRLAGVDRAYRPPAGGEVVRDASGEPTGLLRERAQEPVRAALTDALASRTPEERQTHFHHVAQVAAREALAKGVTTFHDAGSSFATIDGLLELAEAGELPIRLYVMVRGESNDVLAERLPNYRMIGAANGYFTVRSIKRQIDGALGAHGAWLLEPYADLDSTGLVLDSVADIERTAQLALLHGFQLSTHAIGDRANREVLDLYERVFATATGAGRDLRWRIEHAQHVHPDDLPRFADLGVIASMQGIHATSDAPWVPLRLGSERAAATSYRWQDLWRSGAVVTNGTDAPVENVDAIASYWASITRLLPDGTRFDPDQRMTREQALEAYTVNNAFAAFEEGIKGRVTPGMLADLVVLSRDILAVPEEEILEAEVLYTVVGGRVRYDGAGTR